MAPKSEFFCTLLYFLRAHMGMVVWAAALKEGSICISSRPIHSLSFVRDALATKWMIRGSAQGVIEAVYALVEPCEVSVAVAFSTK